MYIKNIERELNDLYYLKEFYKEAFTYTAKLFINETILPVILDEMIGMNKIRTPVGKKITSYKDIDELYFSVVGKVEVVIDNTQDLYKVEIKDNDE